MDHLNTPSGDKMRAFPSISWLLAVVLAVCPTAFAQTYPSKPITMVVPYPAGGPSDFVARQMQVEMGKSLGQPVIVENLGGVAGALGVQKMINAPADGHTVTLGSPLELIITPLTLAAVKFTPADFKMVGQIVRAPMVLLARKDLPANTVDELMALAKAPGAKALSAANTGTGSMFHLVSEKFSQQTGIPLIHVPYKGGAPVITDLMGGQIDLSFAIFAGSIPSLIAEGKLKAIGLTTKDKLPGFAHLTPLASLPQLQGFEFNSWAGIQVPKNTPEATSARLNKAVYDALQNPDIRKAFEASGDTVVPATSLADLDKLLKAEVERYQAIAKSINLQPQ
jgi:tripartite-type tricarboxylate transporter receptor subunit TctC